MQWLAGMRMTEDRLNDNTADETTTAGLTAATNFAVSSFEGKKVNGVTTVNCVVTYTGSALVATSAGNVTPDVLACTLPVGWRPPETVTTSFDRSGTADGSISISTSGACTVRTMSPNATGTTGTVTFFAEWISENA